ncbi:het-domain-containing protein [Fusarium flagelliforme]|uniref:Het-domain-containing protein n=1 Tax=Fusarium flagelliforme TaxID=2675880 RepID=A0A395MN83_9HYPO|nr:het-domain-containing protein [Fusarium flagelliforme]
MSATRSTKPPPTLGSRIRKTMVLSVFNNRRHQFLPEGEIDGIVTRDFIIWAFYKSQYHPTLTPPVQKVINCILTKKIKKTFSIFVLIGLKGAALYGLMVFLLERGINDDCLPFKESKLEEFYPILEHEEDTKGMRGDQDDSEDATWTDDHVSEFLDKQWRFCSPTFSTSKDNHDFDTQAILPFTEKHPGSAAAGAFGEVMKYKIYQSHLDTCDLKIPCTEFVAVKKIKLEGNQDRQIKITGWEKEVRALWKMRALREEHIVNFITAFRFGQDEHYLILEWADGGNLRTLWESFTQPLTAELVRDAFDQLLGLSRALFRVHNPMDENKLYQHFRHGDLKPENILWFKDSSDSTRIGTLKIGDWGLAKQHSDVTQLRTIQTSTGFGTRRYEPPEERTVHGNSLIVPTKTGNIARRRSRLYDLWAMGCIWLEFLIWLMYGSEGLDAFNRSFNRGQAENPSYYEIDMNGMAKVHHVALRWLEHMARDPVCQVGQTALGNLLEIIRDRLLVVKLPQNFGSTRDMSKIPQGRPRSSPSSNTSTGIAPPRGLAPGPNIPMIDVNEPSQTPDSTEQNQAISVTVSPPSPPFKGPKYSDRDCRARAEDLYNRMIEITTDEDAANYWLSGRPLPSPGSTVQSPQGQPSGGSQTGLSVSQGLSLALTERLEDDWKIVIDNEFADRVMSSIKANNFNISALSESTQLCGQCLAFRDGLLSPGFSISYDLKLLEANSSADLCDLCSLLWALCQKAGNASTARVSFQRNGTTLLLNSYTPVASIFRKAGLSMGMDTQIQLSPSALPCAGSAAHLEIVRQWLQQCDRYHQGCKRTQTWSSSNSLGANKTLPTRVIAVNGINDERVHLLETNSSHKGSWVALSHQWGSGQQFRTLRTNIKEHIAGIRLTDLPRTFRDAVKVTRAIGCPFLWIDSICIIQGPDGDFQQEAKQMEQVYSGAYCVLAASRCPGHDAGFLGPRKESQCISLRTDRDAQPFFLRETIDDFQNHVLDGPLGGRGWVLQEHALARRTVYYTDYQCYFECGDGVRCETLTKMTNQRATFLADPNFPRLMMKADKGAKILGYQDLYKMYSGLGLTLATDRPWAINGLQERIIAALGVQGGFGVFFEDNKEGRRRGLLRRSLLWRRADKEGTLTPIKFCPSPSGTKVPSWSWMAYTGSIEYIPADFGGTEWEFVQTQWDSDPNKANDGALVAGARDYTDGGQHSMLVFDSSSGSKQSVTKCVVLGKQKGSQSDAEKIHYVLLVEPDASSGQGQHHKRVGAGTLLGKFLCENKERIQIV